MLGLSLKGELASPYPGWASAYVESLLICPPWSGERRGEEKRGEEKRGRNWRDTKQQGRKGNHAEKQSVLHQLVRQRCRALPCLAPAQGSHLRCAADGPRKGWPGQPGNFHFQPEAMGHSTGAGSGRGFKKERTSYKKICRVGIKPSEKFIPQEKVHVVVLFCF